MMYEMSSVLSLYERPVHMSRYGCCCIFLYHAPEEQQAEIRQKLIQIVIEHLSGER